MGAVRADGGGLIRADVRLTSAEEASIEQGLSRLISGRMSMAERVVFAEQWGPVLKSVQFRRFADGEATLDMTPANL